MNFDIPKPTQEKEPRWLSLEEVKSELSRLREKEQFRAISEVERMKENEKGVYLYEIVATDEKGDTAVYIYQVAGGFLSDLKITPESRARSIVISVGYFKGSLDDGNWQSGYTLSDYDENSGKWTDAK